MKTPIVFWSRGDIFWGLVVGAAILFVVVLMVVYPEIFWRRGSRAGFGPDWDCQFVPKSEPVCIKRQPKKVGD